MVKVRVSEGLLEGELVDNEYGGTFCSFKGIPYAQPPLGDLRFKAPQPPIPWDGVRHAKEFGPVCFQLDHLIMQDEAKGSEDCLFLNVYTPNLKPDKPLPVMFWIHGGGLFAGSGNDDLYGPEFLVRQGVILVTSNYRLEVLGFLCLDTEEVPGNAGMKDQVEALRWVNKNISNFGGDPNNITIFGESSGSCSVSYHLISPMSKGLFKRAICQSGVATAWWGKVFEPRKRAELLARKLGYNSKSNKTLYEFFKLQPAESLVRVKLPLSFSEQVRLSFELSIGIVSEKQFGNNEAFFTGNLSDYFVHEGVEVITGYTEQEGILMFVFAEFSKMLAQANDMDIYFTPKHIALNCSLKTQIEVGQKIKQYHMCDESLKTDWERLARFHSFEMHIYPMMKWAKYCVRRNKMYLYKFSCKTRLNLASSIFGLEAITGGKEIACHFDDIFYIFNCKAVKNKIDQNSEDFKLINTVTKLWTNFAKYGNPTPNDDLGVHWQPYTVEKEDYLDIGNKLQEGTAPEHDGYTFWEGIFKKYAPEYNDKEF